MAIRVRRGDIVLVALHGAVGSEINNIGKGDRPCIVVQNDTGNQYAPSTIIVPLRDRAASIPTHVPVEPGDGRGLSKPSIIQCEQMRTIDLTRISAVIGSLSAECMDAVDIALLTALGFGVEP